MTIDIQAAAREYLRRGWQVVPVPARRKAPVLEGWPDLRLTEGDISTAFGNGENIGVLVGRLSGGVVDVDLDSTEARALADRFLPATGRVHGRPGKPASHRWYRCDEAPPPARFQAPDGVTLVELRSTGQQTLVPPSVHPSGERLRWEHNGEPAQVDGQALRQCVARVAAAALLART